MKKSFRIFQPRLISYSPYRNFSNQSWQNRGGQGGHGPPTFFQSKKKINNNNRHKLKIHNITPWIGKSICYYLNFIWFSPFVYVCKARAFFSCYYYRIQLFYLYKTWQNNISKNLLNRMPYVPTCLRALRAHVSSCPRAFRALVPTCPHALRALVPRAPSHLACPRSHVPCVP